MKPFGKAAHDGVRSSTLAMRHLGATGRDLPNGIGDKRVLPQDGGKRIARYLRDDRDAGEAPRSRQRWPPHRRKALRKGRSPNPGPPDQGCNSPVTTTARLRERTSTIDAALPVAGKAVPSSSTHQEWMGRRRQGPRIKAVLPPTSHHSNCGSRSTEPAAVTLP